MSCARYVRLGETSLVVTGQSTSEQGVK